MNDFYALYDPKTMDVKSISGSPIEKEFIGTNKVCIVKGNNLLDFLENRRSLHDYYVDVVNGFGELVSKKSHLLFKKKSVSNNIINDLNYQEIFFNCLDIRYIQIEKSIQLKFELNELDKRYQRLFNDTVTSNLPYCMIYITAYRDTSCLFSSHKINLYSLSKNRTLSIQESFNRKISLWGSRILN